MITETTYLRPNITIEHETVGSKTFFVYNFKGINYKVFNSLGNLRIFLVSNDKKWIFQCESEMFLDEFFKMKI